MKRVRTIGILVLCLCMILLTACSGSKADMTISAGQVTATAGETVEIEVTLSEDSNLAATDIEVFFDPSALSYVSYENSDTLSAQIQLGNLAEDGCFHYALATTTPFTDAGTIFTLKLQVAEDAAGEIPLKVEVPTLVNESGEALSAEIVNGSITVQ